MYCVPSTLVFSRHVSRSPLRSFQPHLVTSLSLFAYSFSSSADGTYPTCSQLQMFNPIFVPLSTGNPACQLSLYPLPSLLIFSQYTAFPAMALKITPSFEFGSSVPELAEMEWHSIKRHHSLSFDRGEGCASRGKCVPPPVQLAARYTMKLLTLPLFFVAVLQS